MREIDFENMKKISPLSENVLASDLRKRQRQLSARAKKRTKMWMTYARATAPGGKAGAAALGARVAALKAMRKQGFLKRLKSSDLAEELLIAISKVSGLELLAALAKREKPIKGLPLCKSSHSQIAYLHLKQSLWKSFPSAVCFSAK